MKYVHIALFLNRFIHLAREGRARAGGSKIYIGKEKETEGGKGP